MKPVEKQVKAELSPNVSHAATFFFSPNFPSGTRVKLPVNGRAGKESHRKHSFLFGALDIKPLWNDLQEILEIQIEEGGKKNVFGCQQGSSANLIMPRDM